MGANLDLWCWGFPVFLGATHSFESWGRLLTSGGREVSGRLLAERLLLSQVGLASSERTSFPVLHAGAWGSPQPWAPHSSVLGMEHPDQPLGPDGSRVLGDSPPESSDQLCPVPLRRNRVFGPQTRCSGVQCAGRSLPGGISGSGTGFRGGSLSPLAGLRPLLSQTQGAPGSTSCLGIL